MTKINGGRGYNFKNMYIIKVTVYLFSIGSHTVGPTVLKFGMEDHIYPVEVIGYILFGYPYPQGRGRPKSGSGGPCRQNGAFLCSGLGLCRGLRICSGC